MAELRHKEGQQLGNYRLGRLLGRGGYAEVYLAYHLRLQRQAAIKILHTSLSTKEIADFQREAQIIAACDHAHIIRILDFDVQSGTPFLVMDYLPNGTLRQLHPRTSCVPLPTVISYVNQIADALQYAHAKRLIHRDVKPENMLIGRNNEVILSDFGIAAVAHSTSSMTTQASAGTAPYMSPEQIRAQARAASDQYSLAIVVYEWLSGELPFQGSFTEIFAKHLLAPAPPIRQKMPELSPEVEQVLLTAMEKDPQQRFESVYAFANALAHAGNKQRTRVHGRPARETRVLPAVVKAEPAMLKSAGNAVQNQLPVQPWSKRISRGNISRRTLLASTATLGVLAIGGGAAWWAVNSAERAPYIYTGHKNVVETVAWTHNGKRIASGSVDETLQIWDARTGQNASIYNNHHGIVNAVSWSSDGFYIAAGYTDKTVRVWDTTGGQIAFSYTKHTNIVNTVAWANNGSQQIASGSDDGTVRIWESGGQDIRLIPVHTSGAVTAVAWSPDNQYIASASADKTVNVWNVADNQSVVNFTSHTNTVTSVAWSADGKRIVSGDADSNVYIWDALNPGNTIYCTGNSRHTAAITAVAWSHDGEHVASGSNDNTVKIWDTAGFNVYTYTGHTSSVNTISWSWAPDNNWIASGSNDKTVQVWPPSW